MPDMYDSPTPEGGDEPRDEQSSDQETALLPRSIFGGQKDPEVGSECKFRIVHVYDDEVEVEYVPHKSTKPGRGQAMSDAEDEIDRMAKPEEA